MKRFHQSWIAGFTALTLFTQFCIPSAFALTSCDEVVLSKKQILELIKNERKEYMDRIETWEAKKYFNWLGAQADRKIISMCNDPKKCTPQEVYNVTRKILEEQFSNADHMDARARKFRSGAIFVAMTVAFYWGGEKILAEINDDDSFLGENSWLGGLIGVVLGAFTLKFGTPLLDGMDANIKNKMYRIRGGAKSKPPISKEMQKALTHITDNMFAGMDDLQRAAANMATFQGSGLSGDFLQLGPLTEEFGTLRNELSELTTKLSGTADLASNQGVRTELQARIDDVSKKLVNNENSMARVMADAAFTSRTMYSFVAPDFKWVMFYVNNAFETETRSLEARRHIIEITIARLRKYDAEFKTNPQFEAYYRRVLTSWMQVP